MNQPKPAQVNDPLCWKCSHPASWHSFAGCLAPDGDCGCPITQSEIDEESYISKIKGAFREALTILNAHRTADETVYNEMLDGWTALVNSDPYEALSEQAADCVGKPIHTSKAVQS